MSTVQTPELRDLLAAGVHFGHASGRWHPKMKPYIFATRDKLHIMNLEKTQEQLALVLPILEDRLRAGKLVVIVGTKKQVSPMIAEMGARLGIPYVSERWLGGTLTNWAEMQASIARMKRTEATLENEEEAGRMIKKERVAMEADLKRMHVKFNGVRDLTRKPDVLFVVDPSHEHNAIKESRDQGLEIFGICDTNSDPTVLDHIIPANDDGHKSLKFILGLVEEAIAAGLAARGKDIEKAEKAAVDAVAAADLAAVKIDEEEIEQIEEKVEEEIEKAEKKPAKISKTDEEQAK